MLERKKLGEIAEFRKGRSLSKNDLGEGDASVILYGELYTTYGDYVKDVVSRTTIEKALTATKLCYDDLVLPISSTTKEAQIGKASVIKVKDSVSLGGDAIILRTVINANYLMYYINSTLFEKEKMSCVSGTTIMHLSPKKLAEKTIPIPSLAEQTRIVSILDTFTASIENLKQQIAERRKQYEFYRDQFLDLEGKEGVEMKTLGEVLISLKTGLNPRNNFVLNAPGSNNFYITVRELGLFEIIPVAKTDKVTDKALKLINNRSNLEEGDVLFSGTGTIGRTALVKEKPTNWNIKEGVYALKPHKEIINSRYLVHLLHTNSIIDKISALIVGDPIRSIPMKSLLTVSVPILSLEDQSRTVSVLDTFEASIANLEAQLKEREIQYEYYRNKLLTFE